MVRIRVRVRVRVRVITASMRTLAVSMFPRVQDLTLTLNIFIYRTN